MSKSASATLSSSGAPAVVSAHVNESPLRQVFTLVLAGVASVLLLASLKLPLWQMRLEAPQYRDQDALHISVHPNSLRGDLKELTVLDQYIGVHVPSNLPQFKWLPAVLIASAVLGFVAGLLPTLFRRPVLTFVSCTLAAAVALAAIQAMMQIRDIGHRRDQKVVLVGVKDFTPPFLGTSKIAQFTVSSRFGLGAWLIGAALALQLGAARSSRQKVGKKQSCSEVLGERNGDQIVEGPRPFALPFRSGASPGRACCSRRSSIESSTAVPRST